MELLTPLSALIGLTGTPICLEMILQIYSKTRHVFEAMSMIYNLINDT